MSVGTSRRSLLSLKIFAGAHEPRPRNPETVGGAKASQNLYVINNSTFTKFGGRTG